VFKITKYSSWTRLLRGTLVMSLSPLVMALFLSLVGALFFGSLQFTIECGNWDDNQKAYVNSDGKARCVSIESHK
jgi:hypothetical protein